MRQLYIDKLPDLEEIGCSRFYNQLLRFPSVSTNVELDLFSVRVIIYCSEQNYLLDAPIMTI